MSQVLHGSARTTEAVRRAIQHSQESLRALAKRCGVNQETDGIVTKDCLEDDCLPRDEGYRSDRSKIQRGNTSMSTLELIGLHAPFMRGRIRPNFGCGLRAGHFAIRMQRRSTRPTLRGVA